MRQALISLGSNQGRSQRIIRAALAALMKHPDLELLAWSGYYRTTPQNCPPQADFINAAALVQTALEPEPLLAVLLGIEANFHRLRTIAHGPRTLDLDLIAMEDTTWQSPTLTLPHPRMQDRAFVLVPLREIAPDFWITGRNASVSELCSRCPNLANQGLTRLPLPVPDL